MYMCIYSNLGQNLLKSEMPKKIFVAAVTFIHRTNRILMKFYIDKDLRERECYEGEYLCQ